CGEQRADDTMRTALDMSFPSDSPRASASIATPFHVLNATAEDNRLYTTNANNETPINLSLNNNDTNNTTLQPFNHSIGKWMYERDDYVNEMANDLNLNAMNSFVSDRLDNAVNDGSQELSSDSDVIYIDSVDAGPSGSGINVRKPNHIQTIDCDSLDLSALNVETIEHSFITLDDLSDDDVNPADVHNDANDVEIIKVKFYSKPIEIDSEIEVLSEILTPEDVINFMRINLKQIQDTTHLSFTTIRILLNKYEWNRNGFADNVLQVGIQAVLKHFKCVINYEPKPRRNGKRRKTQHKLMTQTSTKENVVASVITGGNGLAVGGVDNTAANTDLKQCLVCFDEINKSDTFGAECNHCLCIDCWNQYIATHVKDASSDDYITCPGDNCSRIIDDDDIIGIIREPIVCDKYRRLISNKFVTSESRYLRWCPNGDCLHAVRVKNSGPQDVECICKTVFCFKCGDQWHEPLTCDLYKNWAEKYASQTVDPKSANWLTKHTKCCPKCKFPIEKNGGCNYVLCSKCRHQFCYQCLGRCSHGRCLGQNATDAQEAQATDHMLKSDMKEYPKFRDNYQNQHKKLSLERNLQEGVTKKLEREVKCQNVRSALKFLKSAFTVLCHCRQTLMYSYVFRYYAKNEQQVINQYDYHLKQLENTTNSLSKVLVSEAAVITKEDIQYMKRKVQGVYRDCESKRLALVQYIKIGISNDSWKYSLL
ncbi:unnamed protein product, partial [Medioppia subpectinata]